MRTHQRNLAAAAALFALVTACGSDPGTARTASVDDVGGLEVDAGAPEEDAATPEPDAGGPAPCTVMRWPDRDEDGYGDGRADAVCEETPGYVSNNLDCDDDDARVNGGAADEPDDEGLDTNCDGIDGDASALVFVAGDGDDGAAGTAEAPLATLAAALGRAAVDVEKTGVAVSGGVYEGGTLSLVSGVSIHGGYSREEGWTRAEGNEVVLSSAAFEDGAMVGVRAFGVRQQTLLDRLTILVGDHPLVGGSTYGIYAVSSPGLSLRGVRVSVGAGGAGADGPSGLAGSDGGDGARGGDCGGSPGRGGASGCGAEGGAGGGGGSVRNRGEAGLFPPCGGAGGDRGGAGAGRNGSGGCTPGAADAGADGAGASIDGFIGLNDFFYIPLSGADGEPGPDGAPGGGGGGGGGAAVIGGTAGAGGGGGAGGCGGGEGQGGSGGGGSFAIFAIDSTGMRVLGSKLESGSGGAGGAGGLGADGGSGGAGGGGGTGREAFACGGLAGPGAGGSGGAGGEGGSGGSGGGGGGGPSVAILCLRTEVSPDDSELVAGAGGEGGGGPGVVGEVGLSAERWGCGP